MLREKPDRMTNTNSIVAVMRKTYLGRSEPWIHAELRYAQRYRKIVLTTRTENLDLYPWPDIFMPAQLRRLSPAWFRDRVGRCLLGRERYLEGVVEREGVALLHAHFAYDAVWALPLKERTRLPMVTTFHGGGLYEDENVELFRSDYDRLFATGERFIALGGNMREAAIRLGCPEEKIRVIHLAVDLDEWPFQQRPPLEGRLRLLFCARLIEIKGLRYVLEALKLLADAGVDVDLTVIGYVGDTDVREMDHEAYVRESGLQERVTFLGFQPQERFREELRRAHVFLQPSITTTVGQIEGSHPTTLVEAQASGCPVIATHHSDIPEVVRDGVSGWLVQEKRPEEIAAKVQWFARHPESLAEFGANARQHVETHNNAAVENEKLEAVYDELLGAGGTAT